MTQKESELIQIIGLLENPWAVALMVVLVAWSLIWKGLALYKAARRGDTAWYIILLLVNTVGVLEIIYVYFFSKKKEAV